MIIKVKWLSYRTIRSLHRDVGFFVIGLTVIYCISGIFLIFRDTGFLKSDVLIQEIVSVELGADDLGGILHRNVMVIEETENKIRFDDGVYNRKTGAISYISKELPLTLRKLNQLHSVSNKDPKHWFTIAYGISLLFLALSSFWMYRPGTKLFRRGIITAISGSALALLLIL